MLEELEKSYLIFPSWQISEACRQEILVASLQEFENFELFEKKAKQKIESCLLEGFVKKHWK